VGTEGFLVLSEDEQDFLDRFTEIFLYRPVGGLVFGAATGDYFAGAAAAQVLLLVADVAAGYETFEDYEGIRRTVVIGLGFTFAGWIRRAVWKTCCFCSKILVHGRSIWLVKCSAKQVRVKI
jgi:hypothetical protein